jgi:hypothetical protein
MLVYFIIYAVFAGLFSVGYTPVFTDDSLKVRLATDFLMFIFGWAAFPVILGGALKKWASRK